MPFPLAFISAGQLYVCEQGQKPRAIDSQFAREMEERQDKARRRHGWKGDSDEQVAGIPGAAVWGKQAVGSQEPLRVEWKSATRGVQATEVTFALQIGDLGGLFETPIGGGDERRLLHRAQFRVEEIDRNPKTGTLAYAQAVEGGAIHIALKRLIDNSGAEVTDGDSFDQAPSWVPGSADKLVYQSAGIARDARGFVAGIGPYVLHELDLATGTVATLLEDADHDLLLPHKLADGALLFIQRPYEGAGRVNYGRTLLDVLLLPIRLIETLFHYLNFMSWIYSGKPLAKAGEVRAARPDLKKMVLWGRAVEAEKQARRANPDEPRHLVPDSWQLIVRQPDETERVLAKGVLGYDIGADGTIVFTNGKAVYRCTTDSKPEKILEHFPIEKITALA